MKKFASVIIDAVIGSGDKIFDYIIDEEKEAEGISPGSRVLVPFGKSDTEGFVVGVKDKTEVEHSRLKKVSRVLDDFVAVKPEFLQILDSICGRFKLRKIDVLRLFVPSPIRGRKRKKTKKSKSPRSLEVAEKQIELIQQQNVAVNEILACEDVFVLHGVTGSGKTEVYMQVIERMIAEGKSAIMLVPEIGLTPQVLGNFRARFGENVAILHSGLSNGERYDEWLRLHRGEARIAIGARSAIFAPVENLGVVIIDEEHDGSYFSESNPRFFTHEIAKMRCKFNHARLVLGSATPSVETFYRAVCGEYQLITMDRRVNDLQMPAVEVVDMAAEMRGGNGGIFSRALIEKLSNVLESGKQAMVFLNRRGYTSFVMCKSCGWSARCENCDVSLVYHKEDGQLKCHYCGGRWTAVSVCPSCGSNYLKMGATGTQKIVEEIEHLFPSIPVFRMDADNTRTKDSLVEILDKFGATTPAVLVGTQMIAKGHHFPSVSLVGIIDADNSLHFSDYRATERTFALVTQVAGRAGRDASAGEVVLQTYNPSHYVYRLAANYDYRRFFDKEINTRKVTKYPPFTTIVRVLFTGSVDVSIKAHIEKVMKALRAREEEFVYIGAMKSPLGRLQNKFRYQILMRFYRQNEDEMLEFIDSSLHSFDVPRSVSVFLEINPQSLS